MTSTTTSTRAAAPASGVWKFDPMHSALTITARHLMVTKVRGTFEDIDVEIVVAEDPAESRVEVVAQAASVTTGAADRDGHLRSADFLDVENHPTITFRSTSITPYGEGWKLTGDLTIRDVTKPVTFDLSFDGSAQDPYGNTKAALSAVGEIDREEWGLTWNVPLEGGGVLVSRRFGVEFDIQATLAE
jgi:polyisoprenoid-binding protein YceI